MVTLLGNPLEEMMVSDWADWKGQSMEISSAACWVEKMESSWADQLAAETEIEMGLVRD